MAKFQEIAKEYKRMCDKNKICSKCPIKTVMNNTIDSCGTWILINPETAENIIMKWSAEHPVETNEDKFKEVFGYDPYTVTIFDDNFIKWLKKEYKEPKND